MDFSALQLAIYLAATFVAALVAGISGFAFALVAAAVWLHVLTPLQTVTLTVSYGILVQGYGAWKMRHAIRWERVWPFLVGGAFGIAGGILVLRWSTPSHIRAGIGGFMVLYSVYGLARPELRPVNAGLAADIGVGAASGILGALTGLAGILVVIWSQMRGWPRDVQRGVFQPAAVGLLAMCALAFGINGSYAGDTLQLFLLGLPALVAGTWVGFMLYGRLDEATFRRIVLWVLLASGVLLIVPGL